MGTTPEIRPLVAADIPAARAFWLTVPGLGLSSSDEPEALEAFLVRNPGLSWAGVVGADLVGTVLAGHDGRRGFLYHLAVHQDARGHGLSTELITRALEGLAAAGIPRVHALVLADNAPGLSFWAHAGARGWKRRGDLLLFSREL